MGQQQTKQAPKKVSIEDSVIEMRMQCKALNRAAKKAEKEGAVYQKKAKDALRKNDEETAKMYLASAAAKRKESLNCERTAMKMQFMSGQIKSMKNNEKFINSFSTLAQLANQQMGNFDATTMANQMEVFNNRMDELMINNKMVTELMDTQQTQTDSTVQEMKLALQQEIAMEQQNLLHEQEQAHYMKNKAETDKFLDELNGL